MAGQQSSTRRRLPAVARKFFIATWDRIIAHINMFQQKDYKAVQRCGIKSTIHYTWISVRRSLILPYSWQESGISYLTYLQD